MTCFFLMVQLEMETRQKNIDNGSRFRSKSYQVRLIVKARPVGYYVSYFEVLCKKNQKIIQKKKKFGFKFFCLVNIEFDASSNQCDQLV